MTWRVCLCFCLWRKRVVWRLCYRVNDYQSGHRLEPWFVRSDATNTTLRGIAYVWVKVFQFVVPFAACLLLFLKRLLQFFFDRPFMEGLVQDRELWSYLAFVLRLLKFTWRTDDDTRHADIPAVKSRRLISCKGIILRVQVGPFPAIILYSQLRVDES